MSKIKDAKPIVLVNAKDQVTGFREKFATHKLPVPLHRAISIMIFSKDKKKILITKRSFQKPTWGGFWSNAVCSHPYPDETYTHTATRRLKEELGITTHLKKAFDFIYEAKMASNIWGEHEFDAVFTGYYDGPIFPNPSEIEGYEWIGIADFKKDLKKNPKKYTPWFKKILGKLEV